MGGRSIALSVGLALAAQQTAWAQQVAVADGGAGFPDSAQVVADGRYQAGGFHRLLLGSGYRKIWATPIRVPVLDLTRVAGGLRVVGEHRGAQTRALELVSENGRQFRFRLVAKDEGLGLSPALRESVLRGAFQDQTSALYPAASIPAAALAEAAGIPHPSTRLFVLPDDPRLGKYRHEFAGMLGMLEAYPASGEHGAPGFMGFDDVVSTEKLVPRLNAGPGDQVDARGYLAARLFDMVLNDSDRHPGQWRWGTRERSAPRRWVAIAMDRDHVFASYGGWVATIGRLGAPELVPFTDQYWLRGLTSKAGVLDRRLLGGVERSVWDSIAAALQRRLTDSQIDAALARMPAAYRDSSAGQISRKLRIRRDRLPEIAAAFYRRLARVVDIHGTDAAELAQIRSQAGGSVEIFLRAGPAGSAPYFRRRFVPSETQEIRVYLHGGDDTLAIAGPSNSPITVRVIAAKGHLSRSGGVLHNVRIYEDRPETVVYGPDTLVEAGLDRRPWVRAEDDRIEPPRPDRDHRLIPIFRGRRAGFNTGIELGLALEHYGFRHTPYQRQVSVTVGYSLPAGAFGIAAAAEFTRESSPVFLRLSAMASNLQRPWFYGLGNATARGASRDAHRVFHREYISVAELGVQGRRWTASAGPIVRYSTNSDPRSALSGVTPSRGLGDYGQAGLRAQAQLDTRDNGMRPTHGVHLALLTDLYPKLWDSEGAIATVQADAATYLAVSSLPLEPVLALRAGVRRSWGPYPWFEAAFVGGKATLRGYDHDRFAGDAAAYGGGDLRVKLLHFGGPLPGDLGALALADAGRVWVDGEESNHWHTAWGGGLWVSVIDRSALLTTTLAKGSERTALYLGLGFAF